MTSTLIGDHDEARAVLADHSYLVPAAPQPPDDETRTLSWLRAGVARFCEGERHDRRRALAESDLATMDPARLREAADARTTARLAIVGTEPFDLMPLARRVPLAVLATELGVTGEATDAVVDAAVMAAASYLNPDGATADTDDAVALLVRELGPGATEATANRIGLLMQACDATAGLIGNALARALRPASVPLSSGASVPPDSGASVPGNSGAPGEAEAEPGRMGPGEVDAIIAATLRDDPPVRRARRLRPDGEPVLIDITAQTFGSGRRPCPAPDHAVALAAGVVGSVLRRCVLADPHIDYPEAGNLRIPTSLMVAVRPEP